MLDFSTSVTFRTLSGAYSYSPQTEKKIAQIRPAATGSVAGGLAGRKQPSAGVP